MPPDKKEVNMRKTTQCYISRKDQMLMLYRNRKPDDPNEGKWLGIGGKVEAWETPAEANVREVYEETGIRLSADACRFRGIIRFINTEYEDEEIWLYTAAVPDDIRISDCDEGELHWIDTGRIMELSLWEGDRLFLAPLLEGKENVSMTLYYEGERLIKQVLNHK